jgi:hypothetical protein
VKFDKDASELYMPGLDHHINELISGMDISFFSSQKEYGRITKKVYHIKRKNTISQIDIGEHCIEVY